MLPLRTPPARQGFSVVELLVVAGIAGLVLVGIGQLVLLASKPISMGIRESEAIFLAAEGLEAVRALRNESWTDTIAPLTTAAAYYPLIANNRWTLTQQDPGLLQGMYSRTIIMREAYRNDADDLSDSGTVDPNTRRVEATVSWNEHGSEKSVVLETYITNFLDT